MGEWRNHVNQLHLIRGRVIVKSLGLGTSKCKVRKGCILEGELLVHNDNVSKLAKLTYFSANDFSGKQDNAVS
jgi:hypothetical protein